MLYKEDDKIVLYQDCVVKSVSTYFDVSLSGTGLILNSAKVHSRKGIKTGCELSEWEEGVGSQGRVPLLFDGVNFSVDACS